jgi:hypothetical protein
MFEAPIPGESLTLEPKNAAYERPAEITDPEDALVYHLDKLTEERRIKALTLLMEEGLDIRTLTEGILRVAVFKGIHSIDVSLIIAPAVHEYIKTTADMIGIEYREGFERDEEDAELDYQINQTAARKALAKAKADPAESAAMVEEDFEEEEMVEAPKGLMARRSV